MADRIFASIVQQNAVTQVVLQILTVIAAQVATVTSTQVAVTTQFDNDLIDI